MTDSRTLAYINLYAVLGTLENLCELDSKAKEILAEMKKPVSVCFDVKGGPAATIKFTKNGCRMEDGKQPCDIYIPVASCDKFNGIINGTVTPIPAKGFTKIGFLLKTFTALTDRLTELMQPTAEALKDPAFFDLSTTLTFYTISVALSQIGNQDEIGKASASYMLDGEISFLIKDGPAATLRVKDNHLVTVKQKSANPRAIMQFDNMQLANDLFNGKINAMECIGKGTVEIRGMLSMVDNMNRILDRVALYLA
ncbi:MAG: hypothetical protein ACI4K9_00855 [Candidatus Fimenecus sp.]